MVSLFVSWCFSVGVLVVSRLCSDGVLAGPGGVPKLSRQCPGGVPTVPWWCDDGSVGATVQNFIGEQLAAPQGRGRREPLDPRCCAQKKRANHNSSRPVKLGKCHGATASPPGWMERVDHEPSTNRPHTGAIGWQNERNDSQAPGPNPRRWAATRLRRNNHETRACYRDCRTSWPPTSVQPETRERLVGHAPGGAPRNLNRPKNCEGKEKRQATKCPS